MANENDNTITIKKPVAAAALVVAVAVGSSGTVVTQNIVETATQDTILESNPSILQIEDYGDAGNAVSAIECKDYTLMFYIIGSDLECNRSDLEYNPEQDIDIEADGGAASRDMSEMIAVMKEYELDNIVNVVAEIGGTARWMQENLSDVQAARVTIDSSGINVEEKLADTNMGESSTLTEFIDYAYQNYPAQHYLMIFWDHGNGPADGYGYDVLHDGDSLTLKELSQSFQSASFHDFDLIGFDACCMGNMETVNALSEYADYLVASPACEDINGWDYSWLEKLADGNATSREIGSYIVDTFETFYENLDSSNVVATLSCYDLTAYEELYAAVQEYNLDLIGRTNEAFYEALNSNRNRIAGYYSGGGPNESMELLDLKQFYRTLGTEMWETCGGELALEKFVCHTTIKDETMCGISIYLPVKSDRFLTEHMLQYLNCQFDDNYLKFVYNYARIIDKDLEMDLSGLTSKFDEESMEISFQIDAQLAAQVATVYVVTAFPMEDAQGYYLLSTDSDVQEIEKGTWQTVLDMKYFAIADEVLCLMEQYSGEERTDYLSPILYNGKICMMTVEVSMENPDGRIVSIVPYSENNLASKEQYVLKEGDNFAALYPILANEGTDSQYYMGDQVTLQDYDCELDLVDVDFGECVYGLMIKDKNLGVHYSELNEL